MDYLRKNLFPKIEVVNSISLEQTDPHSKKPKKEAAERGLLVKRKQGIESSKHILHQINKN